jgi:hypothetical protein
LLSVLPRARKRTLFARGGNAFWLYQKYDEQCDIQYDIKNNQRLKEEKERRIIYDRKTLVTKIERLKKQKTVYPNDIPIHLLHIICEYDIDCPLQPNFEKKLIASLKQVRTVYCYGCKYRFTIILDKYYRRNYFYVKFISLSNFK